MGEYFKAAEAAPSLYFTNVKSDVVVRSLNSISLVIFLITFLLVVFRHKYFDRNQ